MCHVEVLIPGASFWLLGFMFPAIGLETSVLFSSEVRLRNVYPTTFCDWIEQMSTPVLTGLSSHANTITASLA